MYSSLGNLYVMGVVTFGSKKKLSEHIDMGSSFEDLITTSSTVKMDSKSNKRFGVQNFLNFLVSHLMRDDISFFIFCACMQMDVRAGGLMTRKRAKGRACMQLLVDRISSVHTRSNGSRECL